MNKLSPKVIDAIVNDSSFRKALVYKNHEAFCTIYLKRHLKYDFAFFHREMFRITEAYQHKLNVFMAFRGSGKSTILNLSNALWSITGKHQKKFVVIVSKTRVQSQSHFENIKMELEENELLKHDLGPFQATKEDWGAYTIEIPKYGAKIMCVGSLQNIRGLKYRSNRPDLIICDDLEDITSFEDKKQIDLLYDWVINELFSIGDEKTNIVVLGNLLNPSSIMCKLCVAIRNGDIPGIFRAYPLLDDRNQILWVERYPDEESILAIEKTLPKKKDYDLYSIFDREYRLNMSRISIYGFKYIEYPINTSPFAKEELSISAPMWAFGSVCEWPAFEHTCFSEEGWVDPRTIPAHTSDRPIIVEEPIHKEQMAKTRKALGSPESETQNSSS